MNKKAFTLIEVVIALFLSTIVAVSAYQLLNRTQKSVIKLTTAMENDFPVPIFYSQLERDLLGIVIPPLVRIKEESTKTEVSNIIEGLEKALEKRTGKPTIETKAQIEEIKVNDLFVSQSGENKFFMSFITTGGIKLIPSEAKFKAKPIIKRVIYSLESDKNKSGELKVTFRQSENLDLEKAKSQSKAYDIINRIKSIKTNYWVYEIKDQDKSNAKLVKLESWDPEQVKKYNTQVPAFIYLEIVFFNSTNPKLDYKLNFSYSIPVYFAQSESKTKVEQENIKEAKENKNKNINKNTNAKAKSDKK